MTDDYAPETRRFLQELKRSGVVLGLDRMRALVNALGRPHERVPVIHIAGTNGKGSVAAMLEAMLRGAGWRTGLYTSPHLIRLGERIQVNRTPLEPRQLDAYVREFSPAVEALVAKLGPQMRPSYFEFMTALAFVHFERNACDMAVIETGMGGRLDATNVVRPELSVITSIGLDHTEFLGPTLAAIATEKAGIIKTFRPVVMGRVPPEAEQVIRATATARGAPVFSVAEGFGPGDERLPKTNLPGEFQRANAATAVLAARALPPRWKVNEQGMADALQAVNWPGRWMQLKVGGRAVVVDASHNAEGAAALDRALATAYERTQQRPIIVVGALGAARATPLLQVVARHARELRLVVPGQRRASGHDELAALVPAEFSGRVVRDTLAAIFPAPATCLPEVPVDVPVVVTGSLYLAGEALVRIAPSLGPLDADLQDF